MLDQLACCHHLHEFLDFNNLLYRLLPPTSEWSYKQHEGQQQQGNKPLQLPEYTHVQWYSISFTLAAPRQQFFATH